MNFHWWCRSCLLHPLYLHIHDILCTRDVAHPILKHAILWRCPTFSVSRRTFSRACFDGTQHVLSEHAPMLRTSPVRSDVLIPRFSIWRILAWMCTCAWECRRIITPPLWSVSESLPCPAFHNVVAISFVSYLEPYAAVA